mgnify:CR=1 FL=1
METISNIIGSILRMGFFILIISIPFLIALAYGCLIVTALTWVYSLITNQDYYFVCDQSEILYKINQVGKWTGVVTGLFIIFWIFLVILAFIC